MNKKIKDLSVCPDCGKEQTKSKKYLDECENEYCECYVTRTKKSNVLYWTNPNWG